HQDVVFHDIDLVLNAASYLRAHHWGIVGGAGITPTHQMVGRHRDRVVISGVDAPTPTEVDTVDEFAFMINLATALSAPLAEDPELSWHAYAVEYSVRMRSVGRAVGAIN